MKHEMTRIIVLCVLGSGIALAQMPHEKIDTAAIARIKEEGLKHSRVMEILGALSDVYGPRNGPGGN